MALTESVSIQLGTIMPEFSLQDPQGVDYDSQSVKGNKGLLVAFTCNHCPYAVAIWPRLVTLAKIARTQGVHTVAINPNINPDYPEDSPEFMKIKIQSWGIDFPYLVDKDQRVAKAYDAKCTPDLYLLNAEMKLVYHGRLDDYWKDEQQVKLRYLQTAIEDLAANRPISKEQLPSMGCSIKWI